MSTPVVALTGPTGLSRMYSGPIPPMPILAVQQPTMMQIAFLPRGPLFNPVVITATNATVQNTITTATAKIPPPPMGRMLFATFPPIYKERGSLPSGQIYPPPNP